MKILIKYTSKTGNTKTLCEGVCEYLKQEHEVEMKPINIMEFKTGLNYDEYDLIIVGFWVDKVTAIREANAYIRAIKNKKVLCLGTLGANPESDYTKEVIENVGKLVDESNEYLGTFMCWGSVHHRLLKAIELAQLNPITKKMMDKKYPSFEGARPTNEEDIQNAIEFIKGRL